MRPFASLNLKPFLFADAEAQKEIQKLYMQKSRKLHPDLHAHLTDAERQEKEMELSELNRDYLKLKDNFALIDQVVSEACPQSSPSTEKIPPELAVEYFELQEALSEGISAESIKDQYAAFAAKVSIELKNAESKLLSLSRRFAYTGCGDSGVPWSMHDLEELKKALHKLRYYSSFARDIEKRYANSD